MHCIVDWTTCTDIQPSWDLPFSRTKACALQVAVSCSYECRYMYIHIYEYLSITDCELGQLGPLNSVEAPPSFL